jgi:ring-1,2-phenylacetyl-CoA epoxidase subunit PaaE
MLAFHPLTIAGVERLTDEAVAVTFDVPAALRPAYEFAAGQHVTLRLPSGSDRRSYSICAPAGSGVLRVAIKRIPAGMFSGREWRPGQLVEVLTPTGRFTTGFAPGRARHYGFVAAGSGITPVLSLLATALEVEPASRVSLVYGNRTSGSVMFLDELADLKDRWPDRVHLVHVLSREAGDAELLNGRLDAGRLERILSALVPVSGVDEWFLCGPYGVVTAAERVLASFGVPAGTVHTELFHVDDVTPATAAVREVDGAHEVTVVQDGRASTVTMTPDETVLDAALRVRPDLPYACKGAVCSTCRARVVAGEVRMARNYALEPEELAKGYVLTCQSRPVTAQVTLDYDS